MRHLCDFACFLAKQVLSQLSYTPTFEATFILKHFRALRNPFLRFSVITVPKLAKTPVNRGCCRFVNGHFIGSAVDPLKRFAFHRLASSGNTS
jgi:hypothetical protein